MKYAFTAIAGLVASAGLAMGQPERFKLILDAKEPEIVWAPVTVCFQQGTDPLYAARVEALVHQMNVVRFGQMDYQLTSRWSGAQGSPRALTWSFAGDGINIPNGVGEPASANVLFSMLDAAYAGQGGRATWVGRFTQVFARWQALSGLTYTRVTVGGNDWDDNAAWGSVAAAGLRGDVRIGAHPIDGSSGILAYNQFPANGDMVLDSNDSGNWASTTNSNMFLRNVVAHEHGHGMGLLHVCPSNQTKLMEPFISLAYDGPQQDDIRAAQRHYGDPYETNDTVAQAKPMGALAIPGTINFGNIPAPAVANAALLSIDADTKVDFFSFTTAGSGVVTVTITPVGSTYIQGTQTTNCDTGTSTNGLTMADLSVSVIASNGLTVLGSSSSAPIGQPEVLADVGIPSAGTYYVRVAETSAPTESQLYRITVAATGVPVCPTFTLDPLGATVCEGSQAILLSAAASGTPTPTYQWRKNGVPINLATLQTFSVFTTPGNSGTYDCVAHNSCGDQPSAPAVVTINTAAQITSSPPANQNVAAGSPAQFTVTTAGSPTPALQWRKNNVDILGATNATYTIASTVAGDTGVYDCRATNACDDVFSSPCALTVTGSTCYANCDGTGGLTANDFQCFLNAFVAAQSYANCDGVGGLTANDFQCFLDKYVAGCS